MKIIDLLNKIATANNIEDIPKKIKYGYYVYWYDKKLKDYKNAEVEYTQYLISCKYHNTDFLNDEIEIIEDTPKENKRIEKMKKLSFDEMVTKINEIIDRLNGEDNG